MVPRYFVAFAAPLSWALDDVDARGRQETREGWVARKQKAKPKASGHKD